MCGVMELLIVFILAAIGGGIYAVDQTLRQIKQSLERIASSLPPKP